MISDLLYLEFDNDAQRERLLELLQGLVESSALSGYFTLTSNGEPHDVPRHRPDLSGLVELLAPAESCDGCGEAVYPCTRHAVESLPVDVDAANAGESATLCRCCHDRLSKGGAE